MNTKPANSRAVKRLYAAWLDTKLGPMLAIADEKALLLLEFSERKELETEIKRLQVRLNAVIEPARTTIIEYIEKELELYFEGKLKAFRTPIQMIGSEFQQLVWRALQEIPIGSAISYKKLAENIGRPTASRAVAKANSTNQLAVIVPCHRVINTNGQLGGYAGGINRKEALLNLERKSFT